MRNAPERERYKSMFQSLFGDAYAKTAEFDKLYGDLTDFMKVHFLIAGDHITTDGGCGVHFRAEYNRDLGLAISKNVQQIFDKKNCVLLLRGGRT